jgi:hypothetical protein
MNNLKNLKQRKSVRMIIRLWWMRIRLKLKNWSNGYINNKFVDLNIVYCDDDYVYCNGVRVYDLKKKKYLDYER